MTEAEWNACADPTPMLLFLGGKVSERKLRLFAVACCRGVWQWLVDVRSQRGLEAAESYADGLASLAEFGEARENSLRAMEDAAGDSESAILGHAKWHAATAVAHCAETPFCVDRARDASHEARQADSRHRFETAFPGIEVPYPAPDASEGLSHSALLRDIMGNPFNPIARERSWLTWNDGAIRKMARSIYDDRAFDRLPLLADALEDAGCTDPAILTHCRQPGEHVRGCWVVDLLLGKA